MTFEEHVEHKILQLTKGLRYRSLDPQKFYQNLYPLCFDQNDYLNLNHDPFFKEKLQNISSTAALSSCSSRLLGGENPVYQKVERKFADWKNAEDALLFTTGYQANISLMQALSKIDEQKIEFFSDELNHASLIDGIQLSKANKKVFKHLNYEDLEKKLQSSFSSLKIIVTESIFSMDGDYFNFEKLCNLAQKYECLLVVDEAHAVGVVGEQGRGLVNHHQNSNLISINPCGKAMGTTGAVIVGPAWLRKWMLQSARGFIYSTGPSPWIMEALSHSIDYVKVLDSRRQHLHRISEVFYEGLASQGKQVVGGLGSPIVSWVIGDTQETLIASQKLLQKDIQAMPIRYPTVPSGTDRLRFSLHAGLSLENIHHVLSEIKRC